MGLLRQHRSVAPAPRAPTNAWGDHARTPRAFCDFFRQLQKSKFFSKVKNSQQARGRPRKTILRLPPVAGGTPQTPTD